MLTLAQAAAVYCAAAVLLHLTTTLTAVCRCRLRRPAPAMSDLPPVSIVRPLCGIDAFEEATLRSAFALAYPRYEILLCCATPNDPVTALARRVMAAHPHVPAKLLIGNHTVSENPKLNNVIKGWRAAAYEWIVIADSNVLMPPGYLQDLLAAWRPDTGVVCAPPIGVLPDNFAAELECAFLNTYQAGWQYAADTFGFGFAQGKSMLWRRELLDGAGGIEALGCELAEDAAATKVVRRSGLRVRLSHRPSVQPLGARTLAHVWSRQLRWARLRRATFPLLFLPEILTGSALPILCALLAADRFDVDPLLAASTVAALWYGAEAIAAALCGWQLSWRSPYAWALRDALLPVLWSAAWLGRSFTWRGTEMQTKAT